MRFGFAMQLRHWLRSLNAIRDHTTRRCFHLGVSNSKNQLTPLALRVFERNLSPVRTEEEAKELIERLCVPARLVEDSEF